MKNRDAVLSSESCFASCRIFDRQMGPQGLPIGHHLLHPRYRIRTHARDYPDALSGLRTIGSHSWADTRRGVSFRRLACKAEALWDGLWHHHLLRQFGTIPFPSIFGFHPRLAWDFRYYPYQQQQSVCQLFLLLLSLLFPFPLCFFCFSFSSVMLPLVLSFLLSYLLVLLTSFSFSFSLLSHILCSLVGVLSFFHQPLGWFVHVFCGL